MTINIFRRFLAGLFPWQIRLGTGYQLIGFNGQTISRAWDYERYALYGYRRNPVVKACITQLMQAASSVRMRIEIDGERVLQKDAPADLLPLYGLLKRPNPLQSYEEFIETFVMQLHIGGIVFIKGNGIGLEKIGSLERTKQSPELRLIRPDYVEIEHKGDELTRYVIKQPNSDDKQVKPEEIVHIKFPHPDDQFSGLSPLAAIELSIDTHSDGCLWNRNLLKNNAVPAGILLLKNLIGLRGKERDAVKKEFKKEYGGATKAGEMMILGGESADYKQLSQSPKELDWLDGKMDLMREICSNLSVPSILVGDETSSTYNNKREARKALYVDTVLPLMSKSVTELSNWLVPKYQSENDKRDIRLVLEYSHIDMLREDENERVKRAVVAVRGGVLTPNEGRKELGYNDITDDPKADELQSRLPAVQMPQTEPSGRMNTRSNDPAFHESSLYPSLELRAAKIAGLDSKRATWQKRCEKALRGYFAGQQERVLNALGLPSGRSTRAMDALPGWDDVGLDEDQETKKYSEAMKPLQTGLVIEFGQDALDELEAKGLVFNVERPEFQRWLTENLTERSQLINSTTAKGIRKILDEGAGESAQELAYQIGEMYDKISDSRIVSIARTEVGRASSKATLEGYQQFQTATDETILKEWVTARDANVRDQFPNDHTAMDGVTVGLDEDFPMPGGGTTPGPLLSGNAGFDINCRCATAPLKAGEKPV